MTGLYYFNSLSYTVSNNVIRAINVYSLDGAICEDGLILCI